MSLHTLNKDGGCEDQRGAPSTRAEQLEKSLEVEALLLEHAQTRSTV